MSRYPFPANPNGWFRVAYSNDVARGGVKKLHYFGRDLVLFREQDGAAHVLDAHCPHLGAHMGIGGRVEGDKLRCPFHAWLWKGDGSCAEIPYTDRIPANTHVRSWPVAERHGVIFVYHHASGAAPAFEIPEVPEIGAPGWRAPHVCHWEVRARWLDMNENCVDQAHFKYVHGTLTIPATKAEIQGHVFRAESRPQMKAPGGQGEGCLVTLDYGPGLQIVRINGIIDTLLLNTATPIDDERTDVSFAYTVKTDGDPRKEKLAVSVIRDLEQQFANDLPIWENKAYWATPRLCEGDGPLGLYRQWMKQFF